VTRIALVLGHPDAAAGRFLRALARAYAEGASRAGHELREIDVAALDFRLLRSEAEWRGPPERCIGEAEETIAWAEHVVLLYPLWLGEMPALLKGFLEQLLRPAFTLRTLQGGRSVRIIVTMGMPAFVYRWYFGAHGLKNLQRNILRFCGFRPARATLIGRVESLGEEGRARWLERLRALGAAAA
jgi:putative NADPH-quinone reductase